MGQQAPSGRKPAWKWLVSGGVLVALIAVAALFYFGQSRAPEYATARVDRGDIDATVTTTGNLNAENTVQVGAARFPATSSRFMPISTPKSKKANWWPKSIPRRSRQPWIRRMPR